MVTRESSHRLQKLGICLTVATLLFAVGVMLAVGSFAWREFVASEQLQAIFSSVDLQPDTAIRTKSLKVWLERNASKKDTESWGRVLNEVSGPYVKSQMNNLFLAPSDAPVDWEYRMPGGAADASNTIRAWSIYPQELSRFLETVRPLIERIHTLCADDSLVYLPIADQGFDTELTSYQSLSDVCSLLFLELAHAVHQKDMERISSTLKSLDALVTKFQLPSPGSNYLSVFRSSVLARALHLALDADLLDATQLRDWIVKLKGRADWLEKASALAELRRVNAIESFVSKSEKMSFLAGADALPSMFLARSSMSRDPWVIDDYLLDAQDFHQSALVRMALTLMAMEQIDAPKSLTEIPSNLLQVSDWTNFQGVPLEYEFDPTRKVGILKPKRLKVNYHSDMQLRESYEIDYSKRAQNP